MQPKVQYAALFGPARLNGDFGLDGASMRSLAGRPERTALTTRRRALAMASAHLSFESHARPDD